MATEKKYLDLQGLQHLKEQKVLVKPPSDAAASAAAVKVGHDENGHVVLGGKILPSDIGAAASDDVKNATIKIKINGVEKDFTTNQATNETLEWNISAGDLGVDNAMHFRGVFTTLPTTLTDYNPGDVVLVGGKEYVLALNGTDSAKKWNELGDEGSHALKTVTISGDGTYITGGGNLQANRTLSHKTYDAASAAAVKVGRDSGGHVVLGGALGTVDAGTHKHTITASVPADSFLASVSGTTTKISLNKSTDTFVKSYPGITSNLVTTAITGTNGTVTASKATAGTAVSVAKAGTAVVYGKANVGTAQTVATRASAATTVGNANVGTEISILGIDGSTTASKATAGNAVSVATVDTAKTVATLTNGNLVVGNANVGSSSTVATSVKSATATTTAMKATYDEANECLIFAEGTVTPTVTLNTTSVTSAASSSTKLSSAIGTTSVTPAKANGTITPYTFTDVTVPVAAAAATAFTPAAASSTTIWGVGGTINITPAVAAPDTQTIIPAVSNGTIIPYTFADVIAAKVASAATTVATGALATDASGAAVLTGLGTASTGTAIKTATIQSGTDGDVTVISNVSGNKNSDAVSITASSDDAGSHKHTVQ